MERIRPAKRVFGSTVDFPLLYRQGLQPNKALTQVVSLVARHTQQAGSQTRGTNKQTVDWATSPDQGWSRLGPQP